MSSDAWPSPDAQPGPLPRIDDLPISDRGYEQEAVRAAFDAFYRHAAQLDASLRALEAVEVFRRDADALRNDLRAIRALGVGAGEPDWARPAAEEPRPAIPAVALRLLAEAALIIAVAVIAGISHLAAGPIVALMAAAFVVVALAEWLAARSAYVPPVGGFVEYLEPAPYVEAPGPAWGVVEDDAPAVEPDEETEPEALTVVVAPVEGDAWEAGSKPAADEPGEPRGFFRRRRR